MANDVVFQMYSGPTVTISANRPDITNELTESTVQSISVGGEPWVFFDSPNYGGDFVIYEAGKEKSFPKALKRRVIKSMRMIKAGIESSQVILYPQPFFTGTEESFQRQTPKLEDKYCSLKVAEGAVVFFNDENYKGEKRILLNGDEVQNFNAVKLTSIGKSLKTAREMGPQ